MLSFPYESSSNIPGVYFEEESKTTRKPVNYDSQIYQYDISSNEQSPEQGTSVKSYTKKSTSSKTNNNSHILYQSNISTEEQLQKDDRITLSSEKEKKNTKTRRVTKKGAKEEKTTLSPFDNKQKKAKLAPPIFDSSIYFT